MPKTIYTSDQVAIATAMSKLGHSDKAVEKLCGINAGTVKALRLGLLKRTEIGSRVDTEMTNRIYRILKKGKLRQLRSLADIFRAAAEEVESEIAALTKTA